MNLDDIKNDWQHQSSADAGAIEINQNMLSEMKMNKQMKELSNMKWARIIEGTLFFIIVVLLWQYIAQNFTMSAATISAGILNMFAIIGLAGCIGQVVLISEIDYSKPISELQKDIYRVCSHKLQLTKLLMMSTPFYLAYGFMVCDILFGFDLFLHLEQHMIWFYSVSSALMFIVAAWLFAKLNYHNITTNWVRSTIQFIVGERLVNMAQFINNIEKN